MRTWHTTKAWPPRLRDLIGDEHGMAEKTTFGGLAMLLDGNIAVGVHREEPPVGVRRCRPASAVLALLRNWLGAVRRIAQDRVEVVPARTRHR